MMSRPVLVAIADASPIARMAFGQLIESHPRTQLVAADADSATVLRTLAKNAVDVLLLAAGMAGRGGSALIQASIQAQPDLRVLVRYTADQENRVLEALAEGAAGCLSDSATPDDLIDAVSSVAEGRTWLCPSMQAVMCQRLQLPAEVPVLPRLTGREQDVLRHAAEGGSTRQIAAALNLSESTVKAHFRNAFHKLQATSRSHAVAIWLSTQPLA